MNSKGGQHLKEANKLTRVVSLLQYTTTRVSDDGQRSAVNHECYDTSGASAA